MKTGYIVITIVVVLIIGTYFILSNNQSNQEGGVSVELIAVDWRTVELTDVRTGEIFTINQYDKPILIESFAVWCPTCTEQQKKIRELHEELGDAFISISLDTDPNEDAQKVLEHIQRNDFNWFYAIAPKELTQSLIDEFGIGVVNAPQAPVILIDENKNTRLLKRGVKSVDYLKEELGLDNG